MTRALDRFFHLLFQIAALVAGLTLLVVFANVVARFVLNQPFYWSEEVTAIGVVLITLFPVAHLLRRDWHIRLDLFLGEPGSRRRWWQQLIATVSTILFAGVLAWQAGLATCMVYAQGMREPSLLGAPLWITYSFLLLGSATLLLAGLASLWETARAAGR